MQIKMPEFNARMCMKKDNVSNNKTNANFRNPFGGTQAGDVFGAQCKVTISHEGRKKSEESKQPAARSVMETQMERMMLREQEQAEEFKGEHSGLLDEISEMMKSIQNSYSAGEDKETIEKKQEALNRMLELKKRQEEENEQRIKDAMKGVSGSSKEQAEIDRKNEELLMLLKSFEERDEDGTASKEGASESSEEEQGGAGAQLQESASMLGVSAAKRELATTGAIDELKDDGYAKLAEVNAIMSEISAELRSAEEAAGDENLSEDEKKQLMTEHTKMAQDMLMGNYGYMLELRRKGLQEIKDARELDLKHIQVNPLGGVKQAQQTILDASVDAAFQEMASGVLDKASKELEDRVQAEIDKRNDITADSDEEIQEEAEKKRAEEEAKEEEAEKSKEEEKNSNLDHLIV